MSVVGCSSDVELDTSLVTNQPCAVPCWHNLVPGTSTGSDVRTRLESSPFVQVTTLNYDLVEQNGVQLDIFTWKARGKLYNSVYLRDDRVLRIEIALDYDLTLGDIVDRYGFPETIHIDRGQPDMSWYWITVDYFSRGLTVEGYMRIGPDDAAKFEVNDTVWLSEGAKVTKAIYYEPMSMPDVLRQVFLLSPDQIDRSLAIRQEWQGFGYVKFVK